MKPEWKETVQIAVRTRESGTRERRRRGERLVAGEAVAANGADGCGAGHGDGDGAKARVQARDGAGVTGGGAIEECITSLTL